MNQNKIITQERIVTYANRAYVTRNVENIPCFKIRHNFFKNSFFPSTIIEWKNLDSTLRISKSFVFFKNSILKFIRTSPSIVFNCNNYKGIRLITWLRVGMSHLRKHKLKHNLQDCLNPISSYGLDIEFTSHFLLHYPPFNDERCTLLSTLNKTDSNN